MRVVLCVLGVLKATQRKRQPIREDPSKVSKSMHPSRGTRKRRHTGNGADAPARLRPCSGETRMYRIQCRGRGHRCLLCLPRPCLHRATHAVLRVSGSGSPGWLVTHFIPPPLILLLSSPVLCAAVFSLPWLLALHPHACPGEQRREASNEKVRRAFHPPKNRIFFPFGSLHTDSTIPLKVPFTPPPLLLFCILFYYMVTYLC